MASPQPEVQIDPTEKRETSRWSSILDKLLFAVVTSAAIYVFALLSYSLYFQVHLYSNAINAALQESNRGDVVALAYARAIDFAIVKTSVVFLGFIMAFLGALYVLRTASVVFNLSAGASGSSASLQTSSPGLVMIALGVTTVIFALFARTSVGLEYEGRSPAKSEVASGDKAPSDADKTRAKGNETKLTAPKQAVIDADFPEFSVGSAELSGKQKDFLRRLVSKLATSQDDILVDAAADPGQSSVLSSVLAERRAAAIQHFLVQSNAPIERIKIMSYGKVPPTESKRSKVISIPKQ